jgi:hypothetical protein
MGSIMHKLIKCNSDSCTPKPRIPNSAFHAEEGSSYRFAQHNTPSRASLMGENFGRKVEKSGTRQCRSSAYKSRSRPPEILQIGRAFISAILENSVGFDSNVNEQIRGIPF